MEKYLAVGGFGFYSPWRPGVFFNCWSIVRWVRSLLSYEMLRLHCPRGRY
jgi:hypothetical protein